MIIFLRGGYDALGAVAPYTNPFYYESRPGISLPPPDLKNPDAVIPLDGRWGLNPALDAVLRPFYQKGQLAFVPFAGTKFVSRSHFQAQDWVEFGQPPGPSPNPSSGFLNRLLQQLGGKRSGVSFTETLPAILRGPVPVANSPLVLPRSSAALSHEVLLDAMYAGHPLAKMVNEGLDLRKEITRELSMEMQTASRNAPGVGSFAHEAGRIGRLIRDNQSYNIGFVDVGGWDTHIGQGGVRGQLSTRLQGLAAGLEQLALALGSAWGKTVVVVMSEFGRTFRENGNHGTDHGHGTTMWVLGGKVYGGAMHGEQTEIAPGRLHEDRDLPVLNEYRAVLGGLFQGMYGLDSNALSQVFPDSKPKRIGLV